MKKLIVPALLTVLLNSAVIFAQTGAIATKQFETAYDVYIRTTLDKIPDIPGVAVVVVKDDKPIFLKAYGMAHREAGVKATTDTLWYIASSTKSFTALAAALLDREGTMRFADSITKYTVGLDLKNG